MLTLGQLTLRLLTLDHCQRAPALVGPTCSGSKSATPTAADLNPAAIECSSRHHHLIDQPCAHTSIGMWDAGVYICSFLEGS